MEENNKNSVGTFHILLDNTEAKDPQMRESLKAKYEKLYTFMGETPHVEVSDKMISIQVDSAHFTPYAKKLDRAVALCEQRKFDSAEPLLQEILHNCPFHSEGYRMLAQIEMERDHIDQAIDICIDALRYCPSNLWALILMGNLLMRKNDLPTADTYYQKVMTFYPDNALALNNIGANYMQRGEVHRAIECFNKAIAQQPDYLNTYYGMAMAHQSEGHDMEAFEWIHKGLLKGIDRPENAQTRSECVKMMITLAGSIVRKQDYDQSVQHYRELLEARDAAPIEMKDDPKLPLYAQLKYRYAYYEKKHVVVYNSTKQYYQHHILHELTHLSMALDARAEGKNQIMIQTPESSEAYDKKFKHRFRQAFNKLGTEKMMPIYRQMQQGLCLQLMNCALDLIVEDRIYAISPAIRPLQLCALLTQEEENIKGLESVQRSPLVPQEIVRLNKVMNLVTGMHLKLLYGINFLNYYKPTREEYRLAEDLFEEYLAYRNDCKPGDEYDLMNYFIESLDCAGLLGMMNEKEVTQYGRQHEGYHVDAPKSEADREQSNADFEAQNAAGKDGARDFMMIMYMMGALEYFDGMPMDKIRRTAFEISMVGINGISPDGKGYRVKSIPSKEFGGYQFLAYYYVSWALCEPDKVDQLGMPYRPLYENALEMYNRKKH